MEGKNEIKNNSENENEKLLKEKIKNQNNQDDLRMNDAYDKERLKHSKNLYDTQDENKRILFDQQRHLYEHKKDKQEPLLNIYSKPLKEEYLNEFNYISRNSIISIILSILILIQSYLILKHFRLYSENVLTLIFGSFTFFISFLVLIELYRNALRDQIRFKLHKLFSLILSIFLLCLIISQIMNSYIAYDKIKKKQELCEKNEKGCGYMLIYNIILILICVNLLGIIFMIKFQIWLGYNSITVLLGCQLEVIEKQILEDKNEQKGNKSDDIKNKENKENIHKKQD